MKKILPFLVLSLFVFPIFAGAHGDTSVDELQTSSNMMEHMEDQILGDEIHEEMESLMIGMMNGDLSEQEMNRLVELMEEYPAPNSMMMSRMMSSNNDSMMSNWTDNNNWGMHSGFGGWFGSGWLMFLGGLIWIIAGLMLIIFLGRKIGGK